MFRDANVLQPQLVSWRKVITIVVCLAIAFALFQIFTRKPRVSIGNADIQNPVTFELTFGGQFPHALNLHVTGEIDGHAQLSTPHGTIPLKPGDVDERLAGDFYDAKLILDYTPTDVTQGHLDIAYRVHGVWSKDIRLLRTR